MVKIGQENSCGICVLLIVNFVFCEQVTGKTFTMLLIKDILMVKLVFNTNVTRIFENDDKLLSCYVIIERVKLLIGCIN